MNRTCPDCERTFVTARSSPARRCADCSAARRLARAGGNRAGANTAERRCRACGTYGLPDADQRRCQTCRDLDRPEVARYLTAAERDAICYLVVGMRPRPRPVWFATVTA